MAQTVRPQPVAMPTRTGRGTAVEETLARGSVEGKGRCNMVALSH